MDQGIVERPAPGGVVLPGARLDLPVSGMSCASCVGRVERAASRVPGVESVAVNLATERASVTAGPAFRLPALAVALIGLSYVAASVAAIAFYRLVERPLTKATRSLLEVPPPAAPARGL